MMLKRSRIKLLKLLCPIALGLYMGWFFLSKRLDIPDELRAIPLLLFLVAVCVWFFLRKSWLRCPHCHGKLYDRLPGEDVDSFQCPHCKKNIEIQG